MQVSNFSRNAAPPLADDLQYGARRYSPAQCSGVKIRIQAGAPRQDRINTSYVERSNLTVRHFNKRFARLGLGYSRKLCNHRYAISLFAAAYNFCKVHSTLGCTPAVGLKLATETWTIERLIEEATNQSHATQFDMLSECGLTNFHRDASWL